MLFWNWIFPIQINMNFSQCFHTFCAILSRSLNFAVVDSLKLLIEKEIKGVFQLSFAGSLLSCSGFRKKWSVAHTQHWLGWPLLNFFDISDWLRHVVKLRSMLIHSGRWKIDQQWICAFAIVIRVDDKLMKIRSCHRRCLSVNCIKSLKICWADHGVDDIEKSKKNGNQLCSVSSCIQKRSEIMQQHRERRSQVESSAI